MLTTPPYYRLPDWAPLERVLKSEYGPTAVDAVTAFWFVGYADGPADVGELRLYKHSATRRCLALDADGRAYRYHSTHGSYSPLSAHDALIATLR
jgi:hypothetical protein